MSTGSHKAMINGEIVPYDRCSHIEGNRPPSDIYDKCVLEYFGTGYVYSVYEVPQGGGKRPCHFYRFINQ